MLLFVRGITSRLASTLLVLVGVSMLIFFIARIIPGDPARVALGARATVEQVEQMRESLHLNEPIAVQYFYFMRNLFQGDLGISLYTNRPVMLDIRQFLPATLELVFLAGIMMVGIGLPLGAIAARYRGRWPDNAIRLRSSAICPAYL